ncbi:MAG: exodeoxyribonuclease VII small subunit [Ardenticatenaceae bacterium]|nr:exodeoxyribonuclease VII small subunit [Ardenticatenaceae bacterium]
MTEKKTESTEELSFENALEELEQIVAQLEAGELTLEASLTLFERGQKLALHGQKVLEKAQLRVEYLTEDGEIKELGDG